MIYKYPHAVLTSLYMARPCIPVTAVPVCYVGLCWDFEECKPYPVHPIVRVQYQKQDIIASQKFPNFRVVDTALPTAPKMSCS